MSEYLMENKSAEFVSVGLSNPHLSPLSNIGKGKDKENMKGMKGVRKIDYDDSV